MLTEIYKISDYTITLWKYGTLWRGRVTVMLRTHYTAEPSMKKLDVIEEIAHTIGIAYSFWVKQEGNGE